MRFSHSFFRINGGKRGHGNEGASVAARDEMKVWRIWVNAEERVVSFHREEGFRMLEFHSWDYFQAAIDEYTKQRYRYQ